MADRTPGNNAVVSFDDEPLIVVDNDDNVLGCQTKAVCHSGDGILHRAFSIFVFDRAGRVLLQRRAPDKPLWPDYWANACCSHPRHGEQDADAAGRRIHEELGITPPLQFLYKFTYHARFGDIGSEYELCAIHAAVTDVALAPNTNEIVETRWMEPQALDAALRQQPQEYTPWLKLEWPRIRNEHWDTIELMLASAVPCN